MNNKAHCPDATPEFHLVNRSLGWGDRGKKHNQRKNRHDGGLWFIGMEEATGCDGWTPQQVRDKYANKPEWIQTLPPSQWGDAGKQVRDYTCKIVFPLSKVACAKRLTIDQYRQGYLWQGVCQVCQTNALPIGRKRVGALSPHFKLLFGNGPGDWNAYIECVRHTRFRRLHDLWKQYQPQAVVCFGKAYWPYHREILDLKKPTEILENGDIEVYGNKKIDKKVILTPFFRGGNHLMSDPKARLVSDKLFSWGVSIY